MKAKDKKQLENILSDLKESYNFLMKESTVILKKSNLTTIPESTYTNKLTGETFHSFTKEIGSDLCYLGNAIVKLTNFIEQP